MQRIFIARRHLRRYGPCPVMARTWFGSHLIDLISREHLVNCGALIQGTSWGGIQLDLVENLLESDHHTLVIRQKEVMENLLPSGVFGDYSQPIPKPTPHWYPIPVRSPTS
ncbi:MAG: hypothetical protein F6K19_40165 [Cyanothece sp. SIO1E1]|nr:hypothetical protein [Cyanothece sp. SIO1E1]